MDINAIMTMISTVGFPIFACCVMFYQNNSLQKTLSDIQVTMQKMADGLEDLDERKKNADQGN